MTANGKPLRRRRRFWFFAALPLAPLVVVLLLTRSVVLAPLAASILESKIGGNVTIQHAQWEWSGALRLHGVTLKATSLTGEASEIVSMPKISVAFDTVLPLSLHSIEEIVVEEVTIRVAESSVNAGAYNFSELALARPKGTTWLSSNTELTLTDLALSKISLDKIIIESGIMDNDEWVLGSQKEFGVSRLVTDQGALDVQLNEIDNPLAITMKANDGRLSIEIDDATLDDSIFSFLPRRARVWCEEADLQGGVTTLVVSWSSSEGFSMKADVENVDFFLPEEHVFRWAHYENGQSTRMHGKAKINVRRGTIEYDGKSVSLQDIEGQLHPPNAKHDSMLSFRADLDIFDLPKIGENDTGDLMESMLSQSPFEAKFFIDDFHTADGEADLPVAAAEIVKLFQLQQWDISTKLSVKREAFGENATVRGELLINGANGKYEGFPYPLRDITSSIKFHDNQIELVYLHALGTNGDKVHISGDIEASQDYLVVDLHLHAPHAPLDSALHDALPEDLGKVMSKLFDVEAFQGMKNALPESYGKAYSFGGVIDLDLDIYHDSRKGDEVTVQGEVTFEDVGILYADFPYPVTLQKGKVLVKKEGIFIPNGEVIMFEGAGGGMGELEGAITFPQNGSARPGLNVKLTNEWITSTLLEAVSKSSRDSHDLALGVLTGLGIESRLTAVGDISGNEDGGIDTTFLVNISDGIAVLNETFAKAIHSTGQFWPEGFFFEGVEATIQIKNGVVTMDAATCECGIGSVEVSMNIDRDQFDLVLRGSNLPISPQFVDVLPGTASDVLSDAWNRLHPSGLMDATIRISHSGEEHSLNMEVVPLSLVVSNEETFMSLNLSEGSVIVENTNIFLNGLAFDLKENDTSNGTLEISGSVHGSESDFELNVEADWLGASVGSPLTRAITGIVGGDAGILYYDSLQPEGNAKATLRAHGDAQEILYEIDIIPSSLSATFHKRRAVATFSKEKRDIIQFDNSGINFQNIAGKLGDGVFTLDGIIDKTNGINGVCNLTWEGPSDDGSLFAVLPEVVGETLEAIEIGEGESRLPEGVVTLSGKNWGDLAIGFAGDILLENVSVEVGVPLKEIHGKVRVDGMYDKKNLSELQLALEVDDMMVLGRPINYVTGRLLLDVDSKKLLFENMGGESTSGGVAVEGWLAVGDSKEFEVEISVSEAKIAAKDSDDALASLEGELTGWISIAGVRGDSKSKRGVGKVTVQNGKLKVDPLSNTAMHLLQLALPTADTITGADIDLYIVGDKVVLDAITLTSSKSTNANLVLSGEGTIDIDTFEIDARLNPRAGLPVIRDILGAINDTFYAIDVSGELFNPTVSVAPLPFLSP
jgi:hypothetical protein